MIHSIIVKIIMTCVQKCLIAAYLHPNYFAVTGFVGMVVTTTLCWVACGDRMCEVYDSIVPCTSNRIVAVVEGMELAEVAEPPCSNPLSVEPPCSNPVVVEPGKIETTPEEEDSELEA
jgi:hypothetical protein